MAVSFIHSINVDLHGLWMANAVEEPISFTIFHLYPNVHDRLFVNFSLNDSVHFSSEIRLSSEFSAEDLGQIRIYFDGMLKTVYNFRICPAEITEEVESTEENIDETAPIDSSFLADNTNWVFDPPYQHEE